MNKLLLTAAAVAVFMINSPAMAGESSNDLLDIDKKSTAERALEGKTAQEILNEMACKDKDSGDQVKDSTDGTMHTCP
jgi:hypothetical protein